MPPRLGRETTPLSLVHLENLRRLAYQGAVILPPIPAFYIDDPSMERFLDHYSMRVLDRLGLPPSRDAASLRHNTSPVASAGIPPRLTIGASCLSVTCSGPASP